MPAVQSRRSRGGFDPWPGYVDALSTLLMVIIFVLLVFVLAQAFLSSALSGRDQALARLNRQISELSDMLALERGTSEELRASIARLSADLQTASAARDTLARRLEAALADRNRAGSERDALARERDRLSGLLADAQGRAEVALNRMARLEAQLAEALTRADQARIEADTRARAEADTARALSELQRALEEERAALARLRDQAAALDREVQVGRETIAARLSELARLSAEVQALAALRDRLEAEAAHAAARVVTEEERRRAAEAMLAEERRLGETARAQVALLNRQIAELRAQIARLAAALDAAEETGRDKDAQIANLSQRLNLALAARVEELQRFRSEFYGRMREVLGNRGDIIVVGDRFVLPSEVLFAPGSADLNAEGAEQIRRIASVVRELARDIPPEIPWILRVDGHADRTPIAPGGRFASNWELSAARAITVVRLLALLGVPETRLAATGFGEFQPIDPRETTDALARNRRIEFRLTDR